MAVWTRFLWHVTKLNLFLTPTHPDGAGGLGFLGKGSISFGVILFALSSVIFGRHCDENSFRRGEAGRLRVIICSVYPAGTHSFCWAVDSVCSQAVPSQTPARPVCRRAAAPYPTSFVFGEVSRFHNRGPNLTGRKSHVGGVTRPGHIETVDFRTPGYCLFASRLIDQHAKDRRGA